MMIRSVNHRRKKAPTAQLSLRGFDKHLEQHLRELAKREGISLNKAALKLMKKGAGLSDEPASSTAIGNALDRFIGSWSEEEERDVLEGTSMFEMVDESLWK